MVPLHTWLPDAHTEAPTAGSVDPRRRAAQDGRLRVPAVPLPMFPEAAIAVRAARSWRSAVIGIVYGASCAIVQPDMKQLVAYSSVSHLGFVMLGHLRVQHRRACTGGVLQMVNHGLSTGALFLLVGMIYERRHTREIDRVRRPREASCRSTRALPDRDAVVDRPARAQRLRRRVPDPARRVPGLPGRRDGRHARRRARRGLHADDVPQDVLRPGHEPEVEPPARRERVRADDARAARGAGRADRVGARSVARADREPGRPRRAGPCSRRPRRPRRRRLSRDGSPAATGGVPGGPPIQLHPVSPEGRP